MQVEIMMALEEKFEITLDEEGEWLAAWNSQRRTGGHGTMYTVSSAPSTLDHAAAADVLPAVPRRR